MGRQCVVAGNWKMYKTVEETVQFIKELLPLIEKSKSLAYLAVPFTAIHSASDVAKGTKLLCIGAQNMNDATEGAFTGEIAGRMLVEAGASFVVLGHSERRTIFGESSEFVNRKVKRALLDGLQPIVCIGESLETHNAGETEKFLKDQIEKSLDGLSKEDISKIILAYEPIWAIGTGKTATPELAQEVHAFCRSCIAKIWSKTVANQLVIQYGGSVKPDNLKALLKQPDIDGVLVGGASLTPESFNQLVNWDK